MTAVAQTLNGINRVCKPETDLLAMVVPVFAAMSDPVVMTDTRGNIQFMNVAALRFFRVSVSAYLGVQLVDFLVLVECGEVERIRRHLVTGSSASLRVSFPSPMGVRYALLSVDRTPTGLVMTLKDNTESEKLVAIDSLTGAYNRREFDRLLHLELQRADRGYATTGNLPGVSLLFIDVDHFHGVNERFGHQGGDEALRKVVSVIQDCVRKEDHVCRYGGEEFCVIMPTSNSQGARRVAESVRLAIESLVIRHGGVKFHVTVSIGMSIVAGRRSGLKTINAMRSRTSEIPPTGYSFVAADSGEMLEVESSQKRTVSAPSGDAPISKFVQGLSDLVKASNRAMLEAKSNGRNCVIVGKKVLV